MMKNILLFTLFVSILLGFSQCANPIGLTGGEKDEKGPGIVKDGIYPGNMKTRFTKEPISITFDEWVKLDDVLNQVIVSPPLEHTPTVKLKGKELTFEFDEKEILKEETTYTINFGEAVKDLTEGNPTEDLRYVFSTGDEIDSLKISGSLLNALDGTAIEGAIVMLYENLSDTAFTSIKPFYFAKADKSGRFTISNVKAGTFQVRALANDQGKKYIFDHPEEKIGYMEEVLILNDTFAQAIDMLLFQELAPLQMKESDELAYGHVAYKFNREPFDLNISYDESADFTLIEYENDSVHVWHDRKSPFNIYTSYDTLWYDTLTTKKLKRDEFLEVSRLSLKTSGGRSARAIKKPIHKKEEATFMFNHPIEKINKDSILFYADSIATELDYEFVMDTEDKRKLLLKSNWQESNIYKFQLNPGAITDVYGLKNDTLRFEYLILKKDKFGELQLNILDLNPSYAYIVELLKPDNKALDKFYISGLESFEKLYEFLKPNDYTLKIVEDQNGNQRWDPGSYEEKKYPEKIFSISLETLRANWTVESEVKPTF